MAWGQCLMPKGDRDRAQRLCFRSWTQRNVPAAVQRWVRLSHRCSWCRECIEPERCSLVAERCSVGRKGGCKELAGIGSGGCEVLWMMLMLLMMLMW